MDSIDIIIIVVALLFGALGLYWGSSGRCWRSSA